MAQTERTNAIEDTVVTDPMLFNTVDPAVEIADYNQFDVPYSWMDKIKATMRESLPEQFSRNVTTFQEYVVEGMDYLAKSPEAAKLAGIPAEAQSLAQSKWEQIAPIRTADELNKQYETDKFKLPMSAHLAEGYLQNVEAKERNEYITSQDGGLDIASQFLGGAAGVIEPSNLLPNLMMGPVLKGASIAKIIGANLAESAASSLVAAEGRRVGAGEDISGGQVALETAIGTTLGTAGHFVANKIFDGKTTPTAHEAQIAGEAVRGAIDKSEARMSKLLTQAPEEIRTKATNIINSLLEADARISTDEIIDAVTPKLLPETTQRLSKALDEIQPSSLEEPSQFVFNEKTIVASEDGQTGAKVYSTTIEDGARQAFLTDDPTIKAFSISNSKIVDLDPMDITNVSSKLAQDTINKAQNLKGLSLENKRLVTAIKELNPQERVKVLKELSEENGGAAVKFDGDVYDFGDAISDEPSLQTRLNSSDVSAPKNDTSFLKGVDKEAMFGSAEDAVKATENISLPEVKYVPKIAEAQAKLDEVLMALQEKAKSGFIDEDMVKSLESLKKSDVNFELQESVAKAFVFCTRGAP